MIEEFYRSIEIQDFSFTRESSADYIFNRFVRDNWPIVYFLYNVSNKEAYVGESTNASNRMSSHLNHQDRQRLNQLMVIASDKFNKSAALDIESSFIKYISADGRFKLQNGNAGLKDHPYYQKTHYQQLFEKLWDVFLKKKLVKHTLQWLDNSDVFKYSPYKALSDDQNKSILEIMKRLCSYNHNSIFVEGGAGTGKTVVAVFLMKLLVTDPKAHTILDNDDNDSEKEAIKALKERFPNPTIGLVIPMTSLRKTLKKVFKQVKGLNPGMVIGPSDVIKKEYDILIVDEAHRLRKRRNITNYASFDATNQFLELGDDGTELDWIRMCSSHQIYFYDAGQSIKPADIDHQKFVELKDNSTVLQLNSQHRVKGGEDYIAFVDDLLNIQLDADKVFHKEEYELRLFDSLAELHKCIKERDKEFGLSRLLSGYSWKWKKKSEEPDIMLDGLSLKWNSTNEDWINSPNALNEVGCIHTTQGYDLNYAGIIFGTEIFLNPETQRIEINKANYHDSKGKDGIRDPEQLRTYILSIYKTMMLRGIKGTYVYICDPHLREYMKRFIQVA